MINPGTIIKYIKLKNFAAIYAGMKKREIVIDLSDNRNRIILFIGPNGSGKTAILSNLHPFANPGSLDIRSADGVVMKDQSGYKEIHIELYHDLYICKHFFTPTKEGHSVKSFISKNGEELNPNGNVTSFKEIVLLCMGLESDYLKLLRLGSNVTNFIDMKSADRKNFTSELLSDVDIYSQYYRKVNDDLRYLKSLLRIVVDKLDKLNIFDKKDIINDNKRLTNILEREKEVKSTLEAKLYMNKSDVMTLIGNVDEFYMRITTKTKRNKDLEKEIYDLDSKMRRYIHGSTREELLVSISEMNSSIENMVSMKNFLTTQLNTLLTQKDNKEISLKSLRSGLDYSSMQDLYLQFHRRKEVLDPIYTNFKPTCTKEDILSALRLFQHIDTIIGNINEYDRNRVDKVITLKRNGYNVSTEVKKEVLKIDSQIQELTLSKVKTESNYQPGIIYFAPNGCKPKECPYYISFKKIHMSEADTTNIDKKIHTLEHSRELVMSMLDIEKMIDNINVLLNLEKSLIVSLPDDSFHRDNILSYISGEDSIYDESKFTQYIQVLEEFEEYKELNTKIKELKVEITHMEKNKTTLDILQNELYDLDKEIFSIKEKIYIINLNKPSKEATKECLERELIELTEYTKLDKLFNDLSTEESTLREELKEMNITKTKCDEFISDIPLLENDIKITNTNIANAEEAITQNRFKIMEFDKLTEERLTLEEKFDEMEMLKESLSSTKGLPLLFMKLYMEDIKSKVNELLEIVYDGELEINDFIIDDKEFNIPYTKRGMNVSDIRISSQGERSFISVALSFALMKQSLDKYNVLLLDEIDATLDIKNRRLFIDILERQLDMINARQCFMITHNDMFDDHPVSIIYTTKVDDKSSNVIQIQ